MKIITISDTKKIISELLHAGPDLDSEACRNEDCDWCHRSRCVSMVNGKDQHLVVMYELPDTKTFPEDARFARTVATALKLICRPLPLITGINRLKTEPTYCSLEFDLISKQGSSLSFQWNVSVSNGDSMHQFVVQKKESICIKRFFTTQKGFVCSNDRLEIDLEEIPTFQKYGISKISDISFNDSGDVRIAYI